MVVAAFFVTSRYRMPAVPVLAMLACAAVPRMREAWRAGGAKRFAPIAALVGCAALLAVPSREARASYAAELDFYRGIAYLRHRHDMPAAIELFRRAAARDPNDARIWWELGNALEGARRMDEAVEAWKRAAPLDPWDLRPARRVATYLAQRGDVDGAIAALDAAIAAHARPDAAYAADHLTLAMLRARRGDQARALEELRAAKASDPRFFRAQLGAWARTALADPIDGADFWSFVADALREANQTELADAARRRAER